MTEKLIQVAVRRKTEHVYLPIFQQYPNADYISDQSKLVRCTVFILKLLIKSIPCYPESLDKTRGNQKSR